MEQKDNLNYSSEYLDGKEYITKRDRSARVSDYEYGRIRSSYDETKDIPVFAIIEYDTNGEVRYEDYTELVKYLDKFIEANVKEKSIKNKQTNEVEIKKVIQGNALIKLKISEKEMEFAINYLSEKNIIIRGIDSSLDTAFDNYEYITTFKSNDLPDALTDKENKELLKQLDQIKKQISIETRKEEIDKLTIEMKLIRNKLIEGNMRLVNYIVNKVLLISKGQEKDDLLQLGYIVLINHIDKYNVNKGYALSTGLYNYLIYQILHNYNSNLIYVPHYMQTRISEVLKVKHVIEDVLGREATAEEIAMELNSSVKYVQDALNAYNTQFIENFSEINDPEKFDEQYYDYSSDYDQDIEPYEPLSSDDLSEPIIEHKNLKSLLDETLHTLTPREEYVIKMRYGLLDGNMHTLSEVGATLGLSGERIRQIEAKALRKLRHPSTTKLLRNYVEGFETRKYGV